MPKNATPPAATVAHEVVNLPIAAIDVGDQQLREIPEDDALAELAYDIQARGLLQPIGVARLDSGRYQLLFGSRRLAACRRLNRPTIEARILDPGTHVVSTALVENLHRTQLTLREETVAVAQLHHDQGRSPEQIAAMLSKTRSWVLRRLAIPGLPVELRDPLLEGRLALGAAEELARIETADLRNWLLNEALHRDLTVSEIREARQHAQQTLETTSAVETAVTAGLNAPPPPQVFIECQACQAKRLPAELAILRVCAAGCETTDAPATN